MITYRIFLCVEDGPVLSNFFLFLLIAWTTRVQPNSLATLNLVPLNWLSMVQVVGVIVELRNPLQL
jgi:hypothetical protein